MIDRLTTAPKNQFNEFELFEGDIDYLVNRVTSSLLGDVPTKHSTKSGVLTQMGIDLGQCSNKLYYYHLQNRYTMEQDHILMPYISRKGIEFTGLSAEEIEHFDGTIQSLRSLTPEIYAATIKRIYGYYWMHVKTHNLLLIPGLNTAYVHTIALSWLYDYGEKNAKLKAKAFGIFDTGDVSKICNFLLKQKSKSSSTHWEENRLSDILFLLKSRIDFSDNVGVGGVNDSTDLGIISTRLCELGFNPLIAGTNPDFSSISRFSAYIGEECNSTSPGDNFHIWLASKNAPSNVELKSETGGAGLSIEPAGSFVCNWLSETLNDSGARLLKIDRIMTLASEFELCTSIVVKSVKADGMGVEICLPSSSLDAVESTNDPCYDQAAMERILYSLLSDKRIKCGSQLMLNDPVLASKGLCELIGQYRRDPQDNNVAKLRGEFFQDSDWQSAIICPDYLHVRIPPDEISDVVPTTLSAQQSDEFELGISEISTGRLAPDDEAEQFDYYMGAIRQFHPNVIDPPAHTVELLAITGWVDGGIVDNTRNLYNDTILQIWMDGTTKRVQAFKASTAPGIFKKFYNSKGDAHLVKCSGGTTDGRYMYKVGKHKGYVALNQAEDFKVWRDPDKDGIQKPTSLIESGQFGINIHTSDSGSKVNNWSAGCQIIWGGESSLEWSEFIARLDGPSAVHMDPDAIYYTLINSQDMPYVSNSGGGS